MPTLIGMLTRNGQTFITVSKVHAEVQARYYKWLVFNIVSSSPFLVDLRLPACQTDSFFFLCGTTLIQVIVFCVGLAAFNGFLTAFRQPASILPVIADAFPKGATFFVSVNCSPSDCSSVGTN